jgi:uncharacterized protein (TIGR03032 family)
VARAATRALRPTPARLARLWAEHETAWRDPATVAGQLGEDGPVDPRLFAAQVRGDFWDVLRGTGAVLLVTREYEHLLLALDASTSRERTTYLRLPHPSGIAVDEAQGAVHVACTRNPNQVRTLRPVRGLERRTDVALAPLSGRPLVPVATRYLRGCLYLHELAFVDGRLHGNAVGSNAVVRLDGEHDEPVWWPRCIERAGVPGLERNTIQLNSIAAGPDLAGSYFSASTDRPSRRRPGHKDFAVDRRGVVFSGATREPVLCGLTRPHSARLHGGRLWVDDSGYGGLVVADGERPRTVLTLPGWTRGLCFAGDVAFVGTSRVIPRFRQYAPGLDHAHSTCGVHAVDTRSGRLLGSLVWPWGYQVFAVELLPRALATGLPFAAGACAGAERARRLFYAFRADTAAARSRAAARRRTAARGATR